MALTAITRGQTETIGVDLKLETGGALSGLLVDATDHGIVVVADSIPYVFSWGELEAGTAYVVKRDWLALQRGGSQHLTAEDHYQLGLYAITRKRTDLSASEFRKAESLDRTYRELAQLAFDEYRKKTRTAAKTGHIMASLGADDTPETDTRGDGSQRAEIELSHNAVAEAFVSTTPRTRAQALEVYKTFGERVRQLMARDLELIETDHFLIWTDWEKRSQPRLSEWCESMYTALCDQFQIDPETNVFLAKCPVFCWRSRARFIRFARNFDGYDGRNAVGYSRSIQANGHVHLVLVRVGRSPEDYYRFACTLVHEGTHAFLHRFHTTKLIPHWVNEGFADLMAARVLGSRCPNAGNAALLAAVYVRYDWPIDDLIRNAGPIEVYQYPLAHSIVAFQGSLGSERFAGFIKSLKDGESIAQALAANYEGITPAELEKRWRSAVREGLPMYDR
ncbi:MAG: hypothetical protein ACE5HE_09815 [Phycisphaerae bacterium]